MTLMGLDHDPPECLEVLVRAEQPHPADRAVQDVVDLSSGRFAGCSWHGWGSYHYPKLLVKLAASLFPLPIGRFEACSTFTACYGLSARRVAKRPICLEGSDGFVTSTAAPIATGWSDPVAGWELHPLKTNTFHGAH